MPERELVPVPGGRCGEGGIVAKALQWRETPQRAGKPVASGVCSTGYIGRFTRETRTQSGTENGARPSPTSETGSLDQFLGGSH